MKKFITYIVVAIIALPIAGGIVYSFFVTDADLAKSSIEKAYEEAPESNTIAEFEKQMALVDSAVAQFPELKSLADSLVYSNKNEWLSQVEKRESDGLIREAYYLSIEEVKQKLKSPGKAQFPSFNSAESKAWRNENIYISQFWCDAQNAFGGTIRSNWQVTLKNKAGTFVTVEVAEY